MNEQAPQPAIDPQAQAAFDYEHIYPAEQLKQRGQQQVEQHIYDENRPYQDLKGNVHDPANGQFTDIDAYFDKQREIAEDSSQDPYETMSMTELARKLGEAEYDNDKTTSINVSDVLLDKLTEYESKVVDGHDASQKTGERHDTEHNNVFSDNMWDRVMGVKNKEIIRLKEQSQAKPEVKQTEKSDTKPELENKPSVRILSYKPNAEGMSEMATEYAQQGHGIDLAEEAGEDGLCMIINTEENAEFPAMAYYVEDGQVFNLSFMAKTGKEEQGWSVSDMGDQAEVRIGEDILINGVAMSGPVKNMFVEMEDMLADEIGEDVESLDEVSPFTLAGELVDKVQAAEKEAIEASLPVIEAEGRVLAQERPEQVMGWAKRQLERLKNAPRAAGAYASNRLHNVSERFREQEKGRRRTIMGATAGALLLAGAAYLDLKGHGSGNTQELVNGPKGTMANPLEGLNPGSAHSKHQVYREIADHAPKAADKVQHTVTLRHGLTPSHIALEQLQQENLPTDQAHIIARTQHILDLNNMSWEQARRLADNTELKV